MGAWGHGSFENDSAMDFVSEVADAPAGVGDDDNPGRLSLLMGCMLAATVTQQSEAEEDEDEAVEPLDYLDVDICAAVTVAAEVVAAIGGHPHAELLTREDEDDPLAIIAKWCRKTGKDQGVLGSSQAKELAVAAIDRVVNGEESEARDLWSEGEDFEKWKQEMANLRARIGKGRTGH